MARHRSPRGRRAHHSPQPVAPGRAVADAGALRSVPTPVRRGVAVAAVTGGACSLVGAAAPLPLPDVVVAPVAQATLPADAAPLVTEAVLLRSAVEPVEPEPELLDADGLVKAVQLAEQDALRLAAEQRAAQQQAATEAAEAAAAADREQEPVRATGTPDCGLDTSGLGPVKPYVRDAADFLGCLFGEPSMFGVAGRAGTSDHPAGRAVDFMVDRATGDDLAACALRNMDALGVSYVIWRQRINFGEGWKAMEDRGGVTANHLDHVHVSFGTAGGSGAPGGC